MENSHKVLDTDKARIFPSSLTFNGKHIEKPTEIAEAFNDHFATKGSKLASKVSSTAADDHLQYLPADLSSTVPPYGFKS